MSDMSKESAPTGGDPLDIVPDLTEGDDAAPGDEAGIGDQPESSPAARPSDAAADDADPDRSPDQPNPGGKLACADRRSDDCRFNSRPDRAQCPSD